MNNKNEYQKIIDLAVEEWVNLLLIHIRHKQQTLITSANKNKEENKHESK